MAEINIEKMAQNVAQKAIQELRDNGVFVSRWIPVSEGFPEMNVEVLVTTEWDCITIGEMFSNNDWFIHEGTTNANVDDIKAWMPLPEPYRAERSGEE